VPVPRRLDRRPPEQDLTRINERINVPEVRLIDEQGQQVGVLKTAEALRFARERDLDLVEVAPQARPPVCRVLDYSKYKYEQAQKQKQARKHQQQITVREIKFRPKIAQHDYDTKKGHVSRFLLSKYKVKVTIMFRGREVSHPERGVAILDRLAEELTDVAVVEQSPTLDGRNMAMMLAPSKAVLNGQITSAAQAAAARAQDGAAPASEAPADGAPAPEPTVDAQPAAASDDGAPVEAPTAEAPSGEQPAAEAPSGEQPAAEAPSGDGDESEATADDEKPAKADGANAAKSGGEKPAKAPRGKSAGTSGPKTPTAAA